MATQLYNLRNSVLITLVFLFSFSKNTAVAQPILSLEPVISTGLDQPIQFVNAGDGSNRVFIVQKAGNIRVYDASFNFLSAFLTVNNVSTDGERGLLSMAFHPDYANNGFFYVYYTNTAGDLEIARYHVSSNPNVADAASKVIVLTIPHQVNANHNGGELHFGSDGFLYLSTGDGGGGGDVPNNAQNTSVLLGKILRLNVNTSATAPFYTIPAGNPYNNEVFDLGLRNPYRWSFDRLNNDMWIGDVGQDSYEEINHRAAGATANVNYGWRCYEGNNTYNTGGCGPIENYVFPVYTYPSQNPLAAITGGIVYRGAASPAMYGYYMAADFYSGIFYLVTPDGDGGWITSTQPLAPTGMVDFGETEDGEGYVVSLTSNTVYRINGAAGGPLPVSLVSFSGALTDHIVKLNWRTSTEINLKEFEVEYGTDGSTFSSAGHVTAQNISTGAAYSFNHNITDNGPVFYRLKMIDEDGTYRYSATIKILLSDQNGKLVAPSLITNGIININLGNGKYSTVELVNENGALVLSKKIEGQTGKISIPAGGLIPGVYIVRLNSNTAVRTQRIVIQ